jgi:putative DNA primase/helicase
MAMAKAYNGLPGRKRLIELAKAEPGLKTLSSHFDADPWLLNVANGTVNLRSGQLRPHSAEDLITRLAPVHFDPAATCPRFDLFLVEVLRDAETIHVVHKAIGYSATGDVSERKLFFVYGPTSGGKTVFAETIQAAVGDYATLAPTSLLLQKQSETHPCDRMVLKAARMAVFTEMPSNKRLDCATAKTLSGEDTVTGRGMRENYSTFRPTAKLWMFGNHEPIVTDQDESMWVRLFVIPIERTIPEADRDPGLREKLRAELPGILNWIVAGCLAWQRERLGQSAKIHTATGAYRAESDRLAPFIAECCGEDVKLVVSRAALYRGYSEWAAAQGERHPLSERVFAESLRGRGISECWTRINRKQVRAWRGIGLTDNTDYTSAPEFPVKPRENSSRLLTGNGSAEVLSVLSPDAPDPLAQIAHCLRVRPDTTVSDEDRQALVAYFSALNGSAEATVQRLWSYWKVAPSPSVSEFLANERRKSAVGGDPQ